MNHPPATVIGRERLSRRSAKPEMPIHPKGGKFCLPKAVCSPCTEGEADYLPTREHPHVQSRLVVFAAAFCRERPEETRPGALAHRRARRSKCRARKHGSGPHGFRLPRRVDRAARSKRRDHFEFQPPERG